MSRRERKPEEFSAEIEAHIQHETERLREQGLSEEDARAAARRAFGNVTRAQERFHESRHWVWWDQLRQDLRFGFRMLVRNWGFTAVAVFTLALGIGANAAMFSLVQGVLLKPLVNQDESRLIYIRQSAPGLGADNVAFSVPEIQDLRASVKSVREFGDFSEIGFSMVGLGEPRSVRAGVVGGNYFEVMGLHPVLGRLLDAHDDGPSAAGAVVLTYRFWTTVLKSDPSVIGKNVRLDSIGSRTATIIGVLEPCVAYPAETEIIANVVTSPHHLSATMVTGRVHRMTELFGRLAPGATLEQARAELQTAYGAMMQAHPEAYPPKDGFRIETRLLRDQITSRARTILLVLLAASGLVFVIACSNVANLILARTVRRGGELAIRAAVGAGSGALRRMLLAESLLLCGAGVALGVISARPLVAILARYASRFSVRAVDLTVDYSMVWVGVALAIIAAVALAFVPRLPSGDVSNGISQTGGSVRVTGSVSRRQRIFAVTQIAASFVLLVGAGVLVRTLLALRSVRPGVDTDHVLVLNAPVMSYQRTDEQILNFYHEVVRRISQLPQVDQVAVGMLAPWRDAGTFGVGIQYTVDGYNAGPGEEYPRARFRSVSPGFFAALGLPILAGRDFNQADDRLGAEPVAVISESVAEKMFPNQDPLDHHVTFNDPVMKFIPGFNPAPRRVIGVVADFDDESIIPGRPSSIYLPFKDLMFGGRIFIHTHSDPYALVTPVTQIIRQMSADQPVEAAATLKDVRAEVLSPDRLNSLVFSVFAGVALLIAVTGVAGVLAFSVSSRTREFGIRLALGALPRRLLRGVIEEGAAMAGLGVLVGSAVGYVLARLAGSYFLDIKMPGVLTVVFAALVLLAAAVIASMLPAMRAARVDVNEALRSE
jgi:putative ABC transport system permease protein